jgi:hypothetical protein
MSVVVCVSCVCAAAAAAAADNNNTTPNTSFERRAARMGYAKRLLEEEWEQGFRATGKSACANCLENSHLLHLIDDASDGECSYCCGEGAVAEVDDIIGYFLEAISSEYQDGTDAPWDSEEREYFIDTYTIHDILDREFSGDLFNSSELEDDLKEALESRMWVQRDWQILSRSQGLSLSWREFCNAVKHRTRYLYFEPEPDSQDRDPEYVGPIGMLEELDSLIRRYKLIKTVQAGTRLFRVRCGTVPYTTAKDLGPAPDDLASQNRMSAAGISCMYGADDIHTAIEEAREADKPIASIGTFEIVNEMTVVDLTTFPASPSILEKGRTYQRGDVDFLRGLIVDVGKSIEKDNRVHTEYVPTQVVAEYIRHRFKIEKKQVDGIMYSSSKGQGTNFVLFADARFVEGGGAFPKAPKFRLIDVEHRTL